jgi:hypothetical protein
VSRPDFLPPDRHCYKRKRKLPTAIEGNVNGMVDVSWYNLMLSSNSVCFAKVPTQFSGDIVSGSFQKLLVFLQ